MYLFKNNYNNFDMSGFVEELKNIMNKETIIVNIGTDRCIGDAIAPIIGTLLLENNFKLPVYGTVESPIHALNVEKRINDIKLLHPNASIIGIDACLGDSKNIGDIQIRDYPIHPGKGVGKTLPDIGEYSIVGIVDDGDNNVLFTNRTIRLNQILNMAKKIAEGLIRASQYIEVNEVASDNLDNEIKLFRAC